MCQGRCCPDLCHPHAGRIPRRGARIGRARGFLPAIPRPTASWRSGGIEAVKTQAAVKRRTCNQTPVFGQARNPQKSAGHGAIRLRRANLRLGRFRQVGCCFATNFGRDAFWQQGLASFGRGAVAKPSDPAISTASHAKAMAGLINQSWRKRGSTQRENVLYLK